MLNGYAGKNLRVDLSNGDIDEDMLDEKIARQYIGGSGLGARILYNETAAGTDPLSSENVLIFATGPFTGTRAFSSDRFQVIAKSPLTGIYGESDCGGRWAEQFKRNGYDAVVIEGKAETPVYLLTSGEKTEIRDAKHLWGKDTFETAGIVEKEIGSRTQMVCIGQAGENLVKFASIMTGGSNGRTAGRCGLGAVMGSKNLKAIVVAEGKRKTRIAKESEFNDLFLTEIVPEMRGGGTLGLREFGTSSGLLHSTEIGNLPIKNWYGGEWEGSEKISGEAMAQSILKRRYACGRCSIGCGRVVQVTQGPFKQERETAGPEYETLAMLGSNCLIDDLPAIAKANELCNRYGLDTISTGALIAFAMEAYERGLITKKDTDGLEVVWGSSEALIQLIRQIAQRKGLGNILADGVRQAAKSIGKEAEEFAIHVKGLEFPAHDPRARVSVALAYATSNRGACHLQAFNMDFEDGWAMPDLGYPEPLDRFETEGKAEFVAKLQNLMSMIDSLKCCKFSLFGGFTPQRQVRCLNYLTGWDMDLAEFLSTGERIFNLKRLYNVRCGVSRKDDVLPPRILTHSRGGSTVLPFLNKMLGEYYGYRGWDEFGRPQKEKMRELNLP